MKEKLIEKFNIPAFFYPVLCAVYALTLIDMSFFRPGNACALMSLLLIIWIFFSGILPPIRRFTPPDIIMTALFIYCLLSGIWLTAYGIPAGVYAGEMVVSVMPMVFYYVGAYGSKEDTLKIYRYFIFSFIFIGVLGLVLYLAAPQFYIDYLFDYSLISKADASTMRVRMNSVVGSTVLGYMGVAAMCVAASLYIRTKKRLWLAAAAFGCLIAFMSNQRAAMAAGLIVIAFFNIMVFFVYKAIDRKYFIAEAAVILCGAAGLFIAAREVFMKVFYRLISLPAAVGERSDQWIGAANNMPSIWLGNGVGGNGHRAIGYQEHVIADGGLAKLYCETGLIGTALFIFLMLLVLKRGFKDLKNRCAEVCLVIVTILISIGSNTLSFALSVPVFYFAAGVLSAKTGDSDG